MSTIGMILDGSYPKDIRVRKEAEGLTEAGFKVVVLCPCKQGEVTEEVVNGVMIFRFGSNYNFYKKGIYDILGAVNFINPFFSKGIKQLLKKHDIQHLHVHDLPLAKTALKFSNKISGKIILDLHENFPEGLITWNQWKKNPLVILKNKIFFNYKRWFNYEKEMVNKVDLVIAVVDEMKTRLVSLHHCNEDKVIVVSNTEKKEFALSESLNKVYEQFKDYFLVSYIGGIGPHRGLDTAIKGIVKAKTMIPKLKMIIVGSGSKESINFLKELIAKYDLTETVTILGYHPFSEVWGLMKNSSVNIIPHKSNSHTDNTIPHKLFQIMMSGSPLLVSSCNPLKRIVNDHDAGYVFTADSGKSFSNELIKIYENPDEASRKAINAKEAIDNSNLNWEHDSEVLVNLYKGIN